MGHLGFIIFGRKRREKNYGAAYPLFCENCQNEVLFHAFKWRNWGHIFWIPLLPLTATRTLTCPVCGIMYELETEEFKAAKELTARTLEFSEGEISEGEYERALQDFERDCGLLEIEEEDQFDGYMELDDDSDSESVT